MDICLVVEKENMFSETIKLRFSIISKLNPKTFRIWDMVLGFFFPVKIRKNSTSPRHYQQLLQLPFFPNHHRFIDYGSN